MNRQSDIELWAETRGILEQSSPISQLDKLREEHEELAEAVLDNNLNEIKDAIGDMAVVLTIMARMIGSSFEECVEQAWNEIKDRKGKMVDGVFVKEVIND